MEKYEKERLPPRSESTVRVLVENGYGQSLRFSAKEAVLTSAGKKLTLSGEAVLQVVDGAIRARGTSFPLPVTIESPSPMNLDGKVYVGALVVRSDIVVNVVPLEIYLSGVISAEVPHNWPIEALKAQAVVSRTYIARKLIERVDAPFDVGNSEMYQKYEYIEKYSVVNKAIQSTKGIIIVYQNKPIETFFHASSGGITENCRDVFQKDLPYLRSVRDPYTERVDSEQWSYSVDTSQIVRKVSGIPGLNTPSGSLKEVRINSKSASGRVKEFSLFFNDGSEIRVKGNDFRLALDPKAFKSLLVTRIERSQKNGTSVFTFSGRGYGHGVGMSQLGAKAMAEMGFSYREILAFYYRGTRLEHWNAR